MKTLLSLKFIHPTTAQWMRLLSCFAGLADVWLAYAATIQAQPWIPAGLAMYWPVVGLVALVVHQLASTFGVTPDTTAAARLGNAIAEARQIVDAVQAAKALTVASVPPPAPINAAEYRAGMNIAMRGDALPDDASRSATVGFAGVPESERGKYDADGNLKPVANVTPHSAQ